MKANREYELLVRRHPDLIDQVEVVEIASGEVALFWDTEPGQTRRLVRALKADLAQLEADEFLRRWRRWRPDRA